ncbi:MAG: hypothetical protein JNJ45_10925 [Chthonomonas sp.]|nr:hypothetical protein [Chthonomonas sp.]
MTLQQIRPRRNRTKKDRGFALIAAFSVLMLLTFATGSYLDSATQTNRLARRQAVDVQTTGLCEAGVQSSLRSLWRPFRANQTFTAMDAACTGATINNPLSTQSGSLDGVGRFSSGVVGYSTPTGNTYVRNVTIRAVGWVDADNDGVLDTNEARKIVDVQARYELARSAVFDYTYFVNNYGWMSGFGQNDLVVNGDMRANGNFDFSGGDPTVNGSIVAAANDKLIPAAPGLINGSPFKMDDATYRSKVDAATRPGYDSTVHGAAGTSDYETWRDFVFQSTGAISAGRTSGAVKFDASGTKAWVRTGSTATHTTLDTNPSQELIMPDLQNISRYQTLSQTYTNPKATFADGTANPNFGQQPYVEVWNSSTNSYQRISTNGVVTGSAILVGTSSKPVKVHGPVTFTQDVVVKGYVQGQGTLYAGRNVHIVGSWQYVNPPDFRGSPLATEQANEKKDLVALCASGSVIMGNPKQFSDPYPLYYMKPPFTKARYADDGTLIPAYDGTQTDGTGYKKYQSVFGDNALDAISSGVNRVDGILYSNFVGGGNIGTGGGGVTFNGTLISKDEALVTYSLPLKMNYDNRIRERQLTNQPIVDIQLPRSPVLLRSTWQDRGFQW